MSVDAERDPRVISCILPKGKALPLLAQLFHERGITRADVHSARGFVGSNPAGLFQRVEKDLLTLVVPAEQAEAVLEWLYTEADIGAAHGGFMYQTRLSRATPFALPEGIPLENQ